MTGKPTETWWIPWQLDIVEDRGRLWRRATFQPSDMIVFDLAPAEGSIGRKLLPNEQSGSNTIISDGWDHEHCALCGETLSAHEKDQHEGFTDGKEWVCVSCFQKYIAPRRGGHV